MQSEKEFMELLETNLVRTISLVEHGRVVQAYRLLKQMLGETRVRLIRMKYKEDI